jgi:hypothetical protein
MSDFHEQHMYMCVRFCFELGKTFSEAFEMLRQAFGNESMTHAQTYKRYKWLEDG